ILNGVNRIVTVTDEELVWAMKFFAERMKMVVEPTGCLGLAAVRKYKAELQGQRVGVMVTGGNIDIEKLGTLLQS
ncbi:pyridoxal-phosphate dependent enzyme, partial [Pseudomonas helleri]